MLPRLPLTLGLGLALSACGPSVALSPPAAQAARVSARSACRTIDDPKDPSSNTLNGISNGGEIAGNSMLHGYVIEPPYRKRDFRYLSYPGARFTGLSAVNDRREVVGYYIGHRDEVFAFLDEDGQWTSYKGKWKITEFLDISDTGAIVGFYGDRHDVDHPFELGKGKRIRPPGAVGAVASGINHRGDVVGSLTTSKGLTKTFLRKGGTYLEFAYPGSTETEAWGISDREEIVGSYVDAAGATHGFLLSDPAKNPLWQSFDEPDASGTTVIGGIDADDEIVGHYIDAAGTSHGFFCTYP